MEFSESVKDVVFARAGGRCQCTRALCTAHTGQRCARRPGRNGGHFHHLTAQSLLSSHDGASNGQYLCVPCHQQTQSYGR